MKKEYQKPEIKKVRINLKEDVLSASVPGGGSWGYFDEETTAPTDHEPYGDFWD